MRPLTIYKASAGSGKTFQLALNYVALILSYEVEGQAKRQLYPLDRFPNRHREVLAITFTNKATEEMKSRIISVLKELSSPRKRSNYRKPLLDIIDCDNRALAVAAKYALTVLLFDFGNINISTIDSFFQSILRSFAYEADLSGNYDLSLDNKLLTEMAIANTLALAVNSTSANKTNARGKNLREWLYQLINERITLGQDITIFDSKSKFRKDLSEFISDLSDENYQIHSAALAPFFDKENAVGELRDKMSAKFDDLLALNAELAEELLSPDNLKYLNNTTATPLLKKAVNKDLTISSKAKYMEYISTGEVPRSLFKGAPPADLLCRLSEKYREVLINWKFIRTLDLMNSQLYNLGLFSEILQTANEMKVAQNVILLADTNMLINRIIDGCPTPFIYERTGQRLQNYLIDEFQDTSRLQWENLSPLVSDSIANRNFNLIIGDVKQSIYRFRNAEPALLDHELQNSFSPEEIEVPPLTVNHRSASGVVDFNSELFERAAARLEQARPYSTVRQTAAHYKVKSYVSCAKVLSKEEALDRMVEEMQRQLDPNQGGYSPADIVVLVRVKKDGEEVVKRLLAEGRPDGKLPGVRVLSDEALYVRNSPAVQFIIGKLRELNRIKRANDETDQGPANLDITQRVKTTDREMDWLKCELQKIHVDGINDEDALSELIKRFDANNRMAPVDPEADEKWRASVRGRALFEIVESLIHNLPNPAWAETEAIFISAFQDLILDFSRTSAPGVNNFLNVWDSTLEANAAVGLAAGVDAIRVMTIHKSKGLEFPCVHLPMINIRLDKEKGKRWYRSREVFDALDLDCDSPDYFPLESSKLFDATFFAGQKKADQKANILDSLNILYVAFTRAIAELTISMTPTASKQGIYALPVLTEPLKEMSDTDLPSDEPWECHFGSPTNKEENKKAEEEEKKEQQEKDENNYDDDEKAAPIQTLVIPKYNTVERSSGTWDFTIPAETNDDSY